jgi:CelD/BcsL family acetyltransferase involved in cellulose biosynthesis
MSSQLIVRVHTDAAAAEQIVCDWTALWERCPAATTFQRPEWILSWMRAFQPEQPLIVEVRDGSRLVGIAPFLIYKEGTHRTLGLMGGGVSDYLDVLVEGHSVQHNALNEDGIPRTLSAILSWITRPEFPWDMLNFTDLSSASPLLTLAGNGIRSSHHDVCTHFLVPPGTKHIREVISKHKYENIRNARFRLQRDGTARIELATQETVNEFLNALFALHGTRWGQLGKPGVLADDGIQAFHRDVARELLRRGVLRFYGLRLEAHPVAMLYSFFEREVVYCYLQGFDPAYAKLSTGTLLLGTAIQDAIHEDKKRIDLLRGQESYKYHWGVQDSATFRIQAQREVLLQMQRNNRIAA